MEFYYIFRRRYLKKADSEKGPTQIHDFERRSYSVIIHRENVLYVSNESSYKSICPQHCMLSLTTGCPTKHDSW